MWVHAFIATAMIPYAVSMRCVAAYETRANLSQILDLCGVSLD